MPPLYACFKNCLGFLFFPCYYYKKTPWGEKSRPGICCAVLQLRYTSWSFTGKRLREGSRTLTTSPCHSPPPSLYHSLQLPNMLSRQTHYGVRKKIPPNHLLSFTWCQPRPALRVLAGHRFSLLPWSRAQDEGPAQGGLQRVSYPEHLDCCSFCVPPPCQPS